MERLTSPSQPPAPPCSDPVPNFSDDECGEAKGGRVERLRRGGRVFPKRKNIKQCWTCRNGAKFKFPTFLGQSKERVSTALSKKV